MRSRLLISCIAFSLNFLLPVNGFAGMGPKRQSSRLTRETRESDWVDRSVQYYNKVMRKERRREEGELDVLSSMGPEQSEKYLWLAKRHYFARYKIKNGAPKQAELIYRKIIDELRKDRYQCDHAHLATATLLLALLLQKQGEVKAARMVFLHFFRFTFVEEVHENKRCACSAKVLQAYALFEMKQGNSSKSLDLANKAISMDKSLSPILKWKQFQEARERHQNLFP
mmetsp:Transcript_29429/g.44564  ORF Transcript_29429/g.44564 Transcript_29429/m.44564 type:complete len:227 (+) Transcript_29429:123-803(+)